MSIIGILKAAIGFGLLIFVHELGHFIAARWMGVRVEVFSLGFGKALWKWKRGNTVYQLSMIPFGGYVKMAGEEDAPDKAAAPDSFNSKSVGRRSVIFAAGVVMNIIFGFLVFMLAYRVGVPMIPAKVGDVQPGSPAWMAGIERGDRITAINNVSPPIDFEDLKLSVTLSGPGKAIHLKIDRAGQEIQKDLTPEYNSSIGMKVVGIDPPFSMALEDPKLLPKPKDGLDLAVPYAAGAAAGDLIVAARVEGGKRCPISTPDDLDNVVNMAGGRQVELFLKREGCPEPLSIKIDLVPVGKPTWLGIQFGSNRVHAVKPGSWADAVGVKEDDRIVAVNGQRVRAPSEIEAALLGGAGRDTTMTPEMQAMQGNYETAESLTVLRAGRTESLTLRAPFAGKLSDTMTFQPDLTVDKTWTSYPARNAGMESGDVIVGINGVLVANHEEFSARLMSDAGRPKQLTWTRDGKEMSATVLQQKRWALPVAFEDIRQEVHAGFRDSLVLGTRKASQWVIRIYGTLRSLIERQISVRHLNGPLAIGYFTYTAAKEGAGTLLYLLGILSVNLGVFNLLPIPVLDGGHLLFAVIEKLRGKPVSEKIRAGATYAGLALILGIAVVAMWNDITGLFFSRL